MLSNIPASPKQIPINRVNPDGLRPIYVNDVVINHTASEFFLTFSQIEAPLIMSPEDAVKIQSIDAVSSGKFVFNPEFAKALMDALQANYDNYIKLLNPGAK